jgi:hypothetical protein
MSHEEVARSVVKLIFHDGVVVPAVRTSLRSRAAIPYEAAVK